MCDYEPDEHCPIWDETERTARVRHACTGCCETISPGDRYRRTATLFDGSWSTAKHCLRCAAMVDALRLKSPDTFCEATLGLDCGEDWADNFGAPPPAVAELAFLLPGEKPGVLV